MKSKCKAIQRIIFMNRLNELSSEDIQNITEHAQVCQECQSLYLEIQKSDTIIKKIKNYQPALEDEEEMISSTMAKINSIDYGNIFIQNKSFFDKLIFTASRKSVRFALTSILLLIVSVYLVEEFSAVRNISSLETYLIISGENAFSKAELIPSDNGFLKFFHNVYNFTFGNSSYMKLSKNLFLVNKEDLNKLFSDFDKLDKSAKERIKTMQQELLNSNTFNIEKITEDKIKNLQDEIDRLNKELQKIKSTRGK